MNMSKRCGNCGNGCWLEPADACMTCKRFDNWIERNCSCSFGITNGTLRPAVKTIAVDFASLEEAVALMLRRAGV